MKRSVRIGEFTYKKIGRRPVRKSEPAMGR